MASQTSALAHFRQWPGRLLVCGGATIVLFALACNRHPVFESEVRALRLIHQLQSEEATYQARYGSYADLPTLKPSAAILVAPDMADDIVAGYRFHIRVSTSEYVLTAWRAKSSDSPFRSFYADETGVIRYSIGSVLATRASPRIDGQSN